MKRQYISPSIYARKVVFNSIMAGSPDIVNGNALSGGASVGGTSYGNNGDGLSKSGWLDEDEEEDY